MAVISKVSVFMGEVSTFIGKFDTNTIKECIGDSINNNRTCTVSQIVRFLKVKRKVAMANQLIEVCSCVKEELAELRVIRLCNRSDSFDINELITCCNTVKGTLKKTVNKLVA